jgi:hypothetical protein
MGRNPRILTPEEIEQVRKLAPYLTREQLADFFEMNRKTFDAIRERQPEVETAYRAGKAEIIGKIAQSLIQDALDGDTTSRIFFLKTQAGWRETNRTEITGAEGGPVQIETTVNDDLRQALDAIARKLASRSESG